MVRDPRAEGRSLGELSPALAWRIARRTGEEFLADNCMHMGAALAYYAMFSLAPMVLVVMWTTGLLLDPETAARVVDEITGVLGPGAASQVREMALAMGSAARAATGATALVAGVSLAIGATGFLVQLQAMLNRAWGLGPGKGGLRRAVVDRLLSGTVILAAPPILLASVLASAVIAALREPLAAIAPQLADASVQVTEPAVSWALEALVFTLVFLVLPDAIVRVRDAVLGGMFTAALFAVGETLLGLYLGREGAVSAFGAAGSLAALLIWMYYSSLILLLGAEFTQVFSQIFGEGIVPRRGARRVVRQALAADAEA